MAWLAGWAYRRKVTVDQTKMDADLADFPVAVLLTAANFTFASARADGYDVRFTSSDGTTLLKHERVAHDQAGQAAEYHVKVPAVSGTADTDFYIYYGKADAADGADPTAVWDSGFLAVYHMKDLTASTLKDSTANARNATKIGAGEPAEAAGKIGKAQDFDGSNDEASADYAGTSADWTVDYWIKWDGQTSAWASTVHIGTGLTGSEDYVGGALSGSYPGRLWLYRTGLLSPTNIGTASWRHIAVRRDATSATTKIYIDGAEDSSTSTLKSLNSGANNKIYLGELASGGGEQLDGKLDEVRVSNIARSPAWIKAAYNSGNGTLLGYGAEEEEIPPAPEGATSIKVLIGGVERTRAARVEIWRESLAGVGRFEVKLDNAGNFYGGAFAPHNEVELKINDVSMMRGWVDDVLPNVDDPAAVYRNLLRVLGRDYGRQLVDFYSSLKMTDTADDIIRGAWGIPMAYSFPSASYPILTYEAKRQYLFQTLQDIAKLVDAEFYVSDEFGSDPTPYWGKMYFYLLADTPSSGVTLKAVAGAGDNNILALGEVGEKVGFDIKNYLEVTTGLDDHWTEGNVAGNWEPDTNVTSVADDSAIYIAGTRSIKATLPANCLQAIFRCAMPEYDSVDLSETAEATCRIFTRAAMSSDPPVETPVRACVFLRDTSGNWIGRWVRAWRRNYWYMLEFPVGGGVDIGGSSPDFAVWNHVGENEWCYAQGATGFTWVINRLLIFWYSVGPYLLSLWADGLRMPPVEARAVREDSASQAAYGKRMLAMTRNDLKSIIEIQACAASELAKRKDPTQKLKVTATFQPLLKYAGQTVVVKAPDSGIGTADAGVTYRIISLHHVAAPKEDLLRGHDAITELELVRHGAAATDPLRMTLVGNPAWTNTQRMDARVRALERG